MGHFRFYRTVGALGDAKELEYVIALHQSCMPGTRDNATVSSLDICRFLKSRYRLTLTHAQAIDVVRDLGGGDVVVEEKMQSSKKKKSSPEDQETPEDALQLHPEPRPSDYSADAAETQMELIDSTREGNNDHDSGGSSKFLSRLRRHTGASDSSPAAVSTGSTFRDLLRGKEPYKSKTEMTTRNHDDLVVPLASDEDVSSLEQIQESVVDESQLPMNRGSGVLSSAAGMSSTNTEAPQAGTDPNASVVDGKDRPEEYLDLVQTLSTLLIPAFARAGHEYWHGPIEHSAPPPPPECQHRILMPFYHTARFVQKWWLKQTSVPNHPEGHMLSDFYEILLADFAGANDFIVNEGFVEALMIQHGEFERAGNKTLIQEMVEAARSQSGRFDLEALANAISSDLAEWQVGSEDQATTFFSDVFGVDNPGLVEQLEAKGDGVEPNIDVEANDDDGDGDRSQKDNGAQFVTHFCCCCCRLLIACCRWFWALFYPANKGPFKAQRYNIDLVVDSFFSGWTNVASWLFFFMSTVMYAALFLAAAELNIEDCDANAGCEIGITVWNWTIIGLSLSFFGIVMLVPLTFGNNPIRRSVFIQLVSVAVAVIYAVVPWVVVDSYKKNLDEDVDTAAADAVNTPYWGLFADFTLVVGFVVAAIYLFQAVNVRIQVRLEKCSTRRLFQVLKYFFATSNLRAESRLKWAAVRKMNALLLNGCELHLRDPEVDWASRLRRASTSDSVPSYVSTDQTMRNFLLRGSQHELVGGYLWTWRRIFNGSYFHTEGLWINSRLVIFQLLQIAVGTLLGYIALSSVDNIAKAADEARADLTSLYPQWVIDLYPTSTMIYRSLYPASIVAIVVEVLLILLYIPSATATVLAYRSQVNPSLGSEYFNKFRAAVDTVHMNSGNALYGMIGSAALFYIIFGGILFLFQWPPTKDFMIRILVWAVGITICCIMKFVLTRTFRKVQYRSFFRIHPGAAALSSIALECWFIGLGGGTLIGRITQFLLAAAFWIGRIDVPFLNADVSMFGYRFDYVPTHFVKDLLVHEAHRHPYMERLAQMYLMKLRHKKFASKAGAAWRQLLVISLLPWMKKRRVFNEERRREALAALDARRRGAEDIPKRRVSVFEQAALEAIAAGGEQAQAVAGDVETGLRDLAQNATSKDDEDSVSDCLESGDITEHLALDRDSANFDSTENNENDSCGERKAFPA